MEKPLGSYFKGRSPYYQVEHYKQKNTYSCILKVGQVWESQKKLSINTNNSYHQGSSL